MLTSQTKKNAVIFLGFFGLAFFSFSLWLLAFWPGLLMPDSFANLLFAANKEYNNWNSYLYILYLQLLGQPFNSVSTIGFFQIILSSAVIGLLFSYYWLNLKVRLFLLGVFATTVLSPIIGIMNIFYIHDWLFNWFHVGLALYFAYKIKSKSPLSPLNLVVATVVAVFISRLRGEAILFLAAFPIVLFLNFKMTKAQTRLFTLTFVSMIFALYLLLPSLLNVKKEPTYLLTAIVNPIGQILLEAPSERLPNDSLEKINKVLDIEIMKARHRPYDINAFFNGAPKNFTSEEHVDFWLHSTKVIFLNFDIFLRNRWQMFLSIAGFKNPDYFSDNLPQLRPGIKELQARFNIYRQEPLPQLSRFLEGVIEQVLYSKNAVQLLLSTLLLPLCLFILILVNFRKLRGSFAAAMLLLWRLPVVLALAPANGFYYLFEFYLFAILILPMVLLELRQADSKN